LDVFLKLLTPSDPRFLPLIRAAVAELCTVCGFPDDEGRKVTLALDEAVANIIRHAYRGAVDRAIEISCSGWSDRLEFTLLDQGKAPDPARLEAHPPDKEELGGRGTHIIRAVMDEVCYRCVPHGNQLKLSKRLPARDRRASGSAKKI